jgi:hypothetical protein
MRSNNWSIAASEDIARIFAANRQAVGIDHCMNLAGQAASRPAHGLFCVPRDTGTVLMHAAVNEL